MFENICYAIFSVLVADSWQDINMTIIRVTKSSVSAMTRPDRVLKMNRVNDIRWTRALYLFLRDTNEVPATRWVNKKFIVSLFLRPEVQEWSVGSLHCLWIPKGRILSCLFHLVTINLLFFLGCRWISNLCLSWHSPL